MHAPLRTGAVHATLSRRILPKTTDPLYYSAPGVHCFTHRLDAGEEVGDLDPRSSPYDGATPWPLEQLELSGPLTQECKACVVMCSLHGSDVRLILNEETEDGNTADILAGIDHSQLALLEVNAYTSNMILINRMRGYEAV